VNEDDKTKPVTSDENGATLESRRQTVTLESDTIATLTYAQTLTETLKSLSPGQIPLNELEIGKEIGNGNYGRVCVGKWKKYRVAFKFCQNKGKMDEFMREVNLMISLPPHPNIVRMYGVSIDSTQPIIVMEYCAGGSLDKVLYDTEEHISDEQKIRWVHEIALGMCHLHKHNIVHRDLAARNILLSHSNLDEAQPKIADFGMSRVLQQDLEGSTKNKFGPIRWMAPESIKHQVYSKKSDVWMFGMLTYEIAVQREPHVAIEQKEVAVFIMNQGLTPEIPNDCPPKLRKLMQMCWKKQPEQRPVSFSTVLAASTT
jgi:serine/threonine protein kinase